MFSSGLCMGPQRHTQETEEIGMKLKKVILLAQNKQAKLTEKLNHP